ncbi:MAG: right-handed parallel beta-helix repeat-containing protein [Myxococcota bacterium]
MRQGPSAIYLLCLLTSLVGCGAGSVETQSAGTAPEDRLGVRSMVCPSLFEAKQIQSASPAFDRDGDGFAQTEDCDDGNRMVYPGVATGCANGETGWRECGSDGQFTACVQSPRCEATAPGRCYYIDPSAGDDLSSGTFEEPWRSFDPVRYSESRFANAVDLAAGDVVYVMGGTLEPTEQIFIRFVEGTPESPITFAGYPGTTPNFAPTAEVVPFFILQSSHIRMRNFEISRGKAAGVWVEESLGVELLHLDIHDISGASANNVSAIYLQSSEDVHIHHNEIRDTRPLDDINGNNLHLSHAVIAFRGGDILLNHNRLYQSLPTEPPSTRSCVLYKHSSDPGDAVFEVAYNQLENCEWYSVGSGTRCTGVHHNLIRNSGPVYITDHGGPTANIDLDVNYNTIVDGEIVLHDPSSTYEPIGQLNVVGNILVDSRENGRTLAVDVGRFLGDPVFDQIVSPDGAGRPGSGALIRFEDNCYFSGSSDLRFGLFAADGSGRGLGAEYGFSDWQSLGLDGGSANENPALDGDFLPENVTCRAAGHWPRR